MSEKPESKICQPLYRVNVLPLLFVPSYQNLNSEFKVYENSAFPGDPSQLFRHPSIVLKV